MKSKSNCKKVIFGVSRNSYNPLEPVCSAMFLNIVQLPVSGWLRSMLWEARALPIATGLTCKPKEDAMPLTPWQHAGLTGRQGCRLMFLLHSDPPYHERQQQWLILGNYIVWKWYSFTRLCAYVCTFASKCQSLLRKSMYHMTSTKGIFQSADLQKLAEQNVPCHSNSYLNLSVLQSCNKIKYPLRPHTLFLKAHKNKEMINVLGEKSLCNPHICLGWKLERV